ncbi:MAG: esterase/lipase family protein [Nitrospira sp.]
MQSERAHQESLRGTKQWIVFVHGFGSSDETWTSLRDALLSDERVTARFEIAPSFNYLSRLFRIPIYQRSPSIGEIAGQLRDHLKRVAPSSDRGQGVDLTLVGHSMGGLVIQKYMEECFASPAAGELQRIRQVILLATPNFGSRIISGLRKMVSLLLPNPQEQALRLFSEPTCDTHEKIRDQIIDAKQWGDSRGLPIPFYCFWGDADAVVPRASSRGYFLYGQCIPGDHNSILKMSRPNKEAASGPEGKRYHEFVSVLLDPHGHSNVWEIERFAYAVKVSPHPPHEAIVARHGAVQRELESDNVAQVVHQVEFSAKNHCADPYVLKYGTSRHGWIDPKKPPLPHHTPADKRAIYENSGNYVWYEVLPNELKPLQGTQGPTARMELDVYRGYDEGRRDFHMHLGKKAFYRRLSFRVDLSDYLAQGWTIKEEPTLVVSDYEPPSDNPDDHSLCLDPSRGGSEPPTRDPYGIWSWEISNRKQGMIGVRWDLTRPSPRI